MKRSIGNISLRIIISIIAIIIGMAIYISNSNYFAKDNASNITYLYRDDQLITSSKDGKEQQKIKKKIRKLKNSNIQYQDTTTLLKYNNKINPSQYVKKNLKESINAYKLTIDNKSYYIKNKKLAENIKRELYTYGITSSKALNQFFETNKFSPYKENDREIFQVEIENNISIKKSKTSKNNIIKDEKNFLFELMHKNQKPKLYTIQKDDTVDKILKNNNITSREFYLDNPEFSVENTDEKPILSEGEKIIVNKIDTDLKIAKYFETVKSEPLKHEVRIEKTTSIPIGEKKIKNPGKDGKQEVAYKNKIVNDKLQYSTETNKRILLEPQDKIILVGADKNSSGNSQDENTFSGDTGTADIIWPIGSRTISCGLGCYPGHKGIDIAGSYGSPIYAAHGGVVIYSQWSPYGGGNELRIYSDGIIYIYCHMRETALVNVGEKVEQGQLVGHEGATGNVTGPHLHFEMHINASQNSWDSGEVVDPRNYLP